MNEDLGKNILLETITEYEGYSNDTKLPWHLENANIVKKHYEVNKKVLEELAKPLAVNQNKIKRLTDKFDKLQKTVDGTRKIERKLKEIQNEVNKINCKKTRVENDIEIYKNQLIYEVSYRSSFFEVVFGKHLKRYNEINGNLKKNKKEKKKIEGEYQEVFERRKSIEKQIEDRNLLTIRTCGQINSLTKEIDILKTKYNEYNNQQKTALQEIEKCEKYFEVNSELYNFLETSLDNYFNKNSQEIANYCSLLLTKSLYFRNNQSWDIIYKPDTKNLIIDYKFPPFDQISNVKEVKYLKTRDEYKDVYYSKTEFNKLYDNLLYQITLLTIYELFIFDKAEAIDAICFNGWLKSKDKSTGHDANNCILTIQTNKTEFLDLDLRYVDCKDCFKKLKGIANSKLHSVIPVAPIIYINREDDRFITPRNIQENLDESSNLAIMDWEDFEHLIREVFEKEFAKSGGEVKVTRSSRDKGVDAIAFDPDPIRGGKIVIQAKRYTNTVGVNAVRDLYGTILNEGATKGILVTTSDYGPDSFEFAKGKPITLLNGSNLLNLLAKNGHKARIDIKEAKQLQLEKEKSLFTNTLF